MLVANGASMAAIAKEVSWSVRTVYLVRAQAGGVERRVEWDPSSARLSATERETIRVGIDAGESFRSIAAGLKRAPSTVTREVKANGGRENYNGWRAHRRANDQARRPKITKLAGNARLRSVVERWLGEELWSPTQISAQLQIDYPDDPMIGFVNLFWPQLGLGGFQWSWLHGGDSEATEHRGWAAPVEAFPGSAVEFIGDGLEVG